MGAQRQIGLDAVRGIAILLVLLFHFNQPVGIGALDAILAPLRIAGWAGVELFFVLSGFLVGDMILDECATTTGFDWRRFALRRAFRLWPILYLYVLAMLLGGIDWGGVWPVLLHVQNYSRQPPSHLWSLAVEEHFYLLAALALPWLATALSPRRLIAALVGLIVAVNLLRIGAVLSGVTWENVHWQTQYRIDALASGVLLAALLRYRPNLFAALQRRRGLLVVAAIGGFALVALRIEALLHYSLELTLAWLAAVPLVVAAHDLELRDALARPTRALAGLGRIAYPLYIWHLSIGNIAALLATNAGLADPLALASIRLGSAIAFAWLLHRSIELPFMALRDRPGRERFNAPAKHYQLS